MNKDQLEVMQDIYNTLKSVTKDKITEYKHTIRDGNNEWTETVNRENICKL